MSNTVVRLENLGKKYLISHQPPERYTALRDVIASRAKRMSKKILHPFRKLEPDPSKEEFWALKDVSFEINQGEVIGIIGRNGAGKTTLLKILSRITEPTAGSFRIKGRVASLLEVGTGFHPELTGRENIYLNGAILGMSKIEMDRKFDEIVAFAEIAPFLDTPVKRYSSGMYVRLAFAVAAHLQQEILLIDEILAVGDIGFQKKCLGALESEAKFGRTVLLVSHNMNAIRNLCPNTIWIDKGQVIQYGPTEDVVRAYEEDVIITIDDHPSMVMRNIRNKSNPDFYIERVEVMDKEGKHGNIFSYNDSFSILVHLCGDPPGRQFGLEFKIYKGSGEFACTGVSGPLHGIYFDRQVKKIRINIGPILLTNGNYTVSLSAMSGMERIDTWENAGSFNIVECHPFALPQEIKTPVCVIQHSFHAAD